MLFGWSKNFNPFTLSAMSVLGVFLGHLLIFFATDFFGTYTTDLYPMIMGGFLAVLGVALLIWATIVSVINLIKYFKLNSEMRTKNDHIVLGLSILALILLVSA